MSEKPESNPEELFITQDETPEAKERKQKILDKLKERAALTFVASEDETLPGVDEPDPIDGDFEPSSESDEDNDIEDDDMFFENEAEEAEFNASIDAIKHINPVVKQVVYGFYGLGPEDHLADTWYQMVPNGVFRAEHILTFPIGHAAIESIKCGNAEQLVCDKPVPATEFRAEYTLDLMIDRYFDAQSVKPNGIVYLIGDEIDGRGHGTFRMMLETATPATGISIKFNGKLRGLLIIGTEAINPINQTNNLVA